MKMIDISWPIFVGSTEYKDRKSILFERTKSIETHSIEEHMLYFHAHTGTHIDMPVHMVLNGLTTTNLDLEHLVNVPALVLDLTQCLDRITKEDLVRYENEIKPNSVLLLKTKNSFLSDNASFDPLFIYLAQDAAEYLVTKRIKVVGIDYLGIERSQPGHPTHKILLGNDVYIIEGLRLAHVESGLYTMICLPLAVQRIDAAPARVVLVK